MSTPASAQAKHVSTLRRPLDGDVLVTVALSPAGDAVGLWAAPPDAAALVGRQPALPFEASFPTVLLDPAVTVRVSVQDPAGRVLTVTTVHDFAFAHPSVGVLADGDLVIVGSRCAWSRAGVVPNAGVWSSSGELRAWDTPVSSASAVLVDGDGVALVGRSVLIGTLGDGSFLPTASCDLELLPCRPTGWIARGPTLHVFDDHGGGGRPTSTPCARRLGERTSRAELGPVPERI